jgi:hypothetical protein
MNAELVVIADQPSRGEYVLGSCTHKMREDDLPLLKKVKKYFGCGAIYYQKDKRKNHSSCYRFEINSQEDIHNTLIPFFDKNPLKSKKLNSFLAFRKIALSIKENLHRNNSGLSKIISLKSKMNK